MADCVTRRHIANTSLLEYARKSRDEGFFNDVIIITSDNEQIMANRLVLSFHSNYFKDLFAKSILQFDITLEIKSVDGPSLKALIDFTYGNSITISNQNVSHLLEGAEYLKIHEVTGFCIEFLLANLTPENSLDVFKAAISCQNEDATQEIQQYISENLYEIVKTNKFEALSKRDLVSCIFTLDSIQTKEASKYHALITWIRQKDTRKLDFVELFKMINLEGISILFLKKVILEEELVTNDTDCQKLALSAYHNLLMAMNSNESHLISLGSLNDPHKVTVLFDVSKEVDRNYPNLTQGLESYCSLKFDDYVYAIGGKFKKNDELKPTNEVVKINLKSGIGKWEKVASMNKKRYAMGGSTFCGTLFVAGGGTEKARSTVTSEFYIPAIDKWKLAPSLNQRRSGHALVFCDGQLYAIGGWASGCYLFSAERLDDLEGEWRYIHPMQTSRRWLAAVNFDGVIYAIGGQSDENRATTLKTVEKYIINANQWENVSAMNIARSSHAACVYQKRIYVVGGISANGNVVKEIESYDPVNDSWCIEETIEDELYSHNLVVV